jgi:hypothetical protein
MAHRKKVTRKDQKPTMEDREHLRGLLNRLERTPVRATVALPPASARTRRATVARTPATAPAYELTPSELRGMLAAAAAVKKTATPASARGTRKRGDRGTKFDMALLGPSSPRPQTPGLLGIVASKSYNLSTEGANRAEAQQHVHRTIAKTPGMDLRTVRSVVQRPGGIRVDMHVGKDLTKDDIALLQRAANKGSTVPRKSGPSGNATQEKESQSAKTQRHVLANQAKGLARSKTGSGRRKTVRRASVRRGNKTRRRRVRQTRERRVRRRPRRTHVNLTR